MAEALQKNMKDKALQAFEAHEHFCKSMLDGYIVVNSQGIIVKCNPLFATLVGQKSKQILKNKSLNDLLTLKIAEETLTVEHFLENTLPTRIDEVKGSTQLRSDLNLIIGIYPFIDGNETVGAFILLRDVTAETNLQDKYKVKATQSITDTLTGLHNRTYFEKFLPTTLRSMKKKPPSEQKLSIIMGDIDHFKHVNDTYGHQAGDHILQEVAKAYGQNFRKTDILCRYGGEEFLAILPSTDLEGAHMAAEKLREAVERLTCEFNGTSIPVTISLGLAQIDIQNETGDDVISRADAALYHAKKQGRNRVSIHLGGHKIDSTLPDKN